MPLTAKRTTTEKQRAQMRARYQLARSLGLCPCGKQRADGLVRCAACAIRHREHKRKVNGSTRRRLHAPSYGLKPLHEQGVFPHLEGR